MKKPPDEHRNPAERIVESFRRTGTASGETGGPEQNGPDVDYSDMGNVNVYKEREDAKKKNK